jgi:hypothetical protein
MRSLSKALVVMAGLDPAIHVFATRRAAKNVDARDEPGHDEEENEGTHLQ